MKTHVSKLLFVFYFVQIALTELEAKLRRRKDKQKDESERDINKTLPDDKEALVINPKKCNCELIFNPLADRAAPFIEAEAKTKRRKGKEEERNDSPSNEPSTKAKGALVFNMKNQRRELIFNPTGDKGSLFIETINNISERPFLKPIQYIKIGTTVRSKVMVLNSDKGELEYRKDPGSIKGLISNGKIESSSTLLNQIPQGELRRWKQSCSQSLKDTFKSSKIGKTSSDAFSNKNIPTKKSVYSNICNEASTSNVASNRNTLEKWTDITDKNNKYGSSNRGDKQKTFNKKRGKQTKQVQKPL